KEIRLVTAKAGIQPDPIQCSFNYVSLNDSPKYEALSYVWGDPNIRVPIVLDKHQFEVTQNLGLALQFLRLPKEDRMLWIDAICINQADSDERSARVQFMSNIYRDAHQVVSWLGDE
ncbi:HET-domain-containing protein, partial [Glonium stellatum]